MCLTKNDLYLVSLIILCIIHQSSSCSPDIVKRGTTIAKDSGLSGAGELCKNQTCNELLECNEVPDDSRYGAFKPECQIESWLIGLSLTLMILVPIFILVLICHCCFKHHCFSRILWRITKRDSQAF